LVYKDKEPMNLPKARRLTSLIKATLIVQLIVQIGAYESRITIKLISLLKRRVCDFPVVVRKFLSSAKDFIRQIDN
jgi:hypothetical protein